MVLQITRYKGWKGPSQKGAEMIWDYPWTSQIWHQTRVCKMRSPQYKQPSNPDQIWEGSSQCWWIYILIYRLLGPSLQFPPLQFIHRTLSHHMWTEAATEVRGHKLKKSCPATQLCDRPRNQRTAYIKNFTLGIPNIVIVCLPRKR